MSKYSAIKVGLDKPPIGDKTIFYASMDGTIQPEVGEFPSWIAGSGIDFKEGAYGLQVRGAMTYPIKGLDLEKPFTFAYTYNVFDDSYQGNWTGIIMLTLKGKDGSTDRKVFVQITTDNNPVGSDVQGVILDCLKNRPFMGGDRLPWSMKNKYRRVTITSDGKFVECYVDGFLSKKYSLAEFPLDDAYKGAPDMQLDINWGHNKVNAQKYGISEVLIAQEYLPPVGLKAYSIESKNDIILPKKSYLGILSQGEINTNIQVTLPATWQIGNGFTNNYVYCSDLINVCQKGYPNVKIKDKNNGLTWANGDKIVIDGILGELITGTPTVKVEGTEVAITGSWSGLNTNSATFTISNIPAEHQSKSLVVSYTATRTRIDKSLLGDNFIDSIIGLKYNNKLYLPKTNSKSAQASFEIPSVTGNKVVTFNSNLVRLRAEIDKPFELLVNLSEVTPKLAPSSLVDYLANQNAFISVASLNQEVPRYPKLLGYMLNCKDIDTAKKANIAFCGGGTPMQINGISNVYSTQAIPSVLAEIEDNDYTKIALNSVNLGEISDVTVKPIIIRPILGKIRDTGELVLVTKIATTNTAKTSVDTGSTTHQTTVYFPTGIFEK